MSMLTYVTYKTYSEHGKAQFDFNSDLEDPMFLV